LGLRFLRHIERNMIIAFVLDASKVTAEHPLASLEKLKAELKAYNPVLLEKEQVVIVNKIDLPEAKETLPHLEEALTKEGLTYWKVSALTKEGIKDLKENLAQRLHVIKKHLHKPTAVVL